MVARLFAATVAASLGLAVSASAQCPVAGCGGCSTPVAYAPTSCGGCGTQMVAAGCNTCGTYGTAVATSAPRRGLFARRSGGRGSYESSSTYVASAPMMMAPMPMMMPATAPSTTVTGTGVVQTSGTTTTSGSVVPASGTTTAPTTGPMPMPAPMPVAYNGMSYDNCNYCPTTTSGRRGLFGRRR